MQELKKKPNNEKDNNQFDATLLLTFQFYITIILHADSSSSPGQNYRETGVFTFSRKVVFGLKMGLTPKNHPK